MVHYLQDDHVWPPIAAGESVQQPPKVRQILNIQILYLVPTGELRWNRALSDDLAVKAIGEQNRSESSRAFRDRLGPGFGTALEY